MRRGFTIVEVLVCCGIFAAVTLVLAGIYGSSLGILETAGGKMMLEQSERETIRRINSIVACAMPPDPTRDAIVSPALNSAAAPAVDFYTIDDPLALPVTFDPRATSTTFYYSRIAFEKGPDGRTFVRLRRLNSSGNPVSVPSPRILAHGLTALTFTRLDRGTLKVHVDGSVTVRNARLQARTITASMDTIVQAVFYLTPQ
ncbi:MAG: hypothetical protein FJX76_24400 [Armatimonadetes bacterium]|nr:hypothetical protein [Armatimonadota bacterium]